MMTKIGLIGQGELAVDIAAICLASGKMRLKVLQWGEPDEEFCRKVEAKLLRTFHGAGTRTPSEDLMKRLLIVQNSNNLSDSDFVMDALSISSRESQILVSDIEPNLQEDCIVCICNPSSRLILYSRSLKRPDKFIALNFPSQLYSMKLVEVVMGQDTSEITLTRVSSLMIRLGRQFIAVRKDIPGYVVERLNIRFLLEGVSMIEDGIPAEIVDSTAKFRLGFPFGVCEIIDRIGMDRVLNRSLALKKAGMDISFSKPLLEGVSAGLLGVSSGEGFYKYPSAGEYKKPSIIPRESMYRISPVRFVAQMVNEAAWLVSNGICSAEDVEKAMKAINGWDIGPMEIADRYSLREIMRYLRLRLNETGMPFYSPQKMLQKKIEKDETGRESGEGFYRWDYESVEFGPVVYKRTGSFSTVTLNRPEKLNALDKQMWDGLREALKMAEVDTGVRSVIVTGKGIAFSAGDDISMMRKWRGKTGSGSWMKRYAGPLVDTLLDYPKPLISAINGIAFGAGCELNMLFDIVIASEGSIFALPEGLIGAMPPIGSTYGMLALNRKIGRYALTGEWFSATEAKDMGIVDMVVPDDQLTAVVHELADKINDNGPISTGSVKASINKARATYSEQLKFGLSELVKIADTDDFKTGQETFGQGRKPAWKGK
ncbi:MAG: 3-hydroxyacyl-CoA dehydrogenase/enoyl-CoA hydratase family protein [Thermoplasmataceae archaeon]